MKLHHSSPSGLKIFTACGSGFVTVGNTQYRRPVVVTPSRILDDWTAQDFDSLNEAHFEYLLALRPEILLLGTGEQQRFPHPRLYQSLIASGIGVEAMNTAAVCRTYNILVAENRQVAAALLL